MCVYMDDVFPCALTVRYCLLSHSGSGSGGRETGRGGSSQEEGNDEEERKEGAISERKGCCLSLSLSSSQCWIRLMDWI